MRDDFTKVTKEILARRVGYRCSNPECRKLTTGPRTNVDEAVNIGVAAHITAAAPGGPRYDPKLSSRLRSSIRNGIWLCQNCAKLVDNDPERYTIEVIREWKTMSEQEALAELESSRDHGLTTGDRITQGLVFAGICMDTTNPGWREISKTKRPFGREFEFNYSLSLAAHNVDPCFDITLMNLGSQPLLLTDVGIEIVTVCHYTYVAGIPKAVKIKKVDTYRVEIPDIWGAITGQSRDLPPSDETKKMRTKEPAEQVPAVRTGSSGEMTIRISPIDLMDFPPIDLYQLVSTKIPDPVYLEPNAPYRYGLLLDKYQKRMPIHALIRLWVRTNAAERRSPEICLFG
jgi:hypothetical protein